MKKFLSVNDLGNLKEALNQAFEIKKNRFAFQNLGKNKTLLMVFFNSSLRTRLSTQKAAMNLGMNVIVLDVNQGAWKLETERGVIMDGDKSEHLLEAIPVMGSYCDIIGVRMFEDEKSVLNLSKKDNILLIYINDERFKGYKIREQGEMTSDGLAFYTYHYKGGVKSLSSRPHAIESIKGVVTEVYQRHYVGSLN